MALTAQTGGIPKPRRSSLASAAGGDKYLTQQDPFGLLHHVPLVSAAPAPSSGGGQRTATPPAPNYPSQQTTPPAPVGVPPSSSTAVAPPPAQYDLGTDPVLQMVQAAAKKADETAAAAALRQREQLLTEYGDPELAAAVLGANDPGVAAARQNQESTRALLGRQHGKNINDFERALDPSLAFSGYRVRQTHGIDQSYQDQLAQAAAGVRGSLGSIQDALAAAEAAQSDRIAQALADAYSRSVAQAEANPPAVDTGSSPSSSSGSSLAAAAAGNPLFDLLNAGVRNRFAGGG